MSDAMDLDDEGDIGRYTMTVRGLAAGTFGAYQAVFLDHDFLAREHGAPGAASMILLYLDDHFAAPRVASSVRAALSPDSNDIEVATWMDEDAFLRSAIHATRAIGAVSETMVVFAVAIPVLALLYINVLRRRRDIGLLSAIGFSSMEIFAVFLLQAAIVGVIGIAIGCALGYGLIAYFQASPIFEWSGFVIRPVVSWGAFVRPAAVVFVVTLLAGAYPAWRASRVDPARVLRGAE
jgi:ABC-type lipoprotein release transport system permease subunit